ncbi:MAG TPA: cupredoxin domain-containing protein [Thermoanaerobaculia bacterium]|nr:cupredoxin domain-containing protein [Thermoanaerobaculia bacterium]
MSKMKRFALYVLAPALLFSLTAALRAEDKAVNVVEVHLSEYKIDMPETLPAGPTNFILHNEGGKSHSFKIEGPGLDGPFSSPIAPHTKGALQVTLQAGEYKITCPIGSHSMKGMTKTLTVTAKTEG